MDLQVAVDTASVLFISAHFHAAGRVPQAGDVLLDELLSIMSEAATETSHISLHSRTYIDVFVAVGLGREDGPDEVLAHCWCLHQVESLTQSLSQVNHVERVAEVPGVDRRRVPGVGRPQANLSPCLGVHVRDENREEAIIRLLENVIRGDERSNLIG